MNIDLVKPYENGKFCIRQLADDDGEYVLCVVYKGKPTHHLITTNGGVKVNKKSYGGATTLEEVSYACYIPREFVPS